MNFSKSIFSKVGKTLSNMGKRATGEDVPEKDKENTGIMNLKETPYNDDGSTKTTVTTVTKEE